MKVTKISEHITKLEAWCLFKISAWLVQAKDGIYIVDTGMAFMGRAVLQQAQKLGEVKGVLLTHGHSDHVGGLKHIIKGTEPPVFAHRIELPYIEGKQPFPGRKKAQALAAPNLIKPLPMDQQGSLLPIGDLIPYHTPGHSPGHVAYYHAEDGVLISGDLFTSKRGRLQKPMAMFTANMEEAVASAKIVADIKPKLVTIAHSPDVEHAYEHIEQYLRSNQAAANNMTPTVIQK